VARRPPTILCAGGRVASRRSGAARPHGSPGAALDEHRRVHNLGLPPGCRVVALREVDGMPDPTHPTTLQALLVAAIPEICPPGEGMFA